MEQILLHLFGDYISQTDWMAKNKTSRLFVAMLHAAIYTLPFLLITQSPVALLVMWFTHVLIDHFRLARYVIFAKNWITDTKLKWVDCVATGYHKDTPPWLAFWLLIIVDNFLHLVINYSSIRWLNFDMSFNSYLIIANLFGASFGAYVMLSKKITVGQ